MDVSQVKLALCQLATSADKEKNIATARSAIQVQLLLFEVLLANGTQSPIYQLQRMSPSVDFTQRVSQNHLLRMSQAWVLHREYHRYASEQSRVEAYSIYEICQARSLRGDGAVQQVMRMMTSLSSKNRCGSSCNMIPICRQVVS